MSINRLKALKKLAGKDKKMKTESENYAMDGMRKREGDDKLKYDDYSEEELRMAREDSKKRGKPFARPGDESNYEKRRTTLERLKDYFSKK